MAKQKPRLGIKPFFTALVYETVEDKVEDSRDVLQADVPSIYAEARLGVASYAKIQAELTKLVQSIKDGKYKGDIPYFKDWLKENRGILDISDLEKVVTKKRHSAALVREEAVQGATQSNLGTLVGSVKSRSTAVSSDTLKLWDVEISNYALVDGDKVNIAFTRDCQCGFKGKHKNKRKLWGKTFLDDLVRANLTTRREVGRELHVACYHEAALITEIELQNNRGKPKTIRGLEHPSTIAFDFINRWDLVFEAVARLYKYKQKCSEVDDYLFSQDIISPYFKKLMEEGTVHKEVIKHSRNFEQQETQANQVLMKLHRRMLQKGLEYKGFAWEFDGVKNSRKDYRTIGIVYEGLDLKTNHPIAYHVIYDNNFWMPYVVRKEFTGEDKKPFKYQKNPLNLLFNPQVRKYFYQVDDRTQRLARVTIDQPRQTLVGLGKAQEKYAHYKTGFLQRQTH